jgi:beta-alanine degradation protein BauB
MNQDPTVTDAEKYKIVFENDKVRVLKYADKPGDKTAPHYHPDSVMITLSSFDRKLLVDGKEVEVKKETGEASWLSAQTHVGENTGSTNTEVVFVELKQPAGPTES